VFKLAEKRRVAWPVTVKVPQDGGKTIKATFGAEFEIITKEEQQAIIAGDGDLLDRQLVGWDARVKDENGEPLPFGDDAKRRLLDITYVRQALFEALGEINSGREAARKN
jgi:hypothetical protein